MSLARGSSNLPLGTKGRRCQVVKARVCKTLISGSNPLAASNRIQGVLFPFFSGRGGELTPTAHFGQKTVFPFIMLSESVGSSCAWAAPSPTWIPVCTGMTSMGLWNDMGERVG